VSAALLAGAGATAATQHASCDLVDLWQVRLERVASAATLHTLAPAERGFARRLRIGAGEWATARAALRCILARYLGLAARDVEFETDANGKPRLAPGAGDGLRFNLSHSGGVALVVVRLGHEVGVDLEELRPGVDGVAITREVFGEREPDKLPTTAEHEREFFRAWVRREALAKAAGRGIVLHLAQRPDHRFTVRDVDGPAGFAAAIASEGSRWSIRRPFE
jgi:4'-phosphopantetheinyl transferase